MEVLAYLHHAQTYETPEILDPIFTQTVNINFSKHFGGSNCRKLSGIVTIPLMVLSSVFPIFWDTKSALALQREDSGSQVTDLQNSLAAQGFYDGPITGFYGEWTEAAVLRFQEANGLVADGIAGSDTLLALQGGASSALTSGTDGGVLARETTGPAVVDLQNQLRATGFFNGSPTGFYGSETEAAVANFQQSNNLTADGVAGPATLAALQNTTPTQDSTSDTGILSRGCNSSTVADLQNNLAAAGYYKGPIDGAYGAMTEAAVMKFQEATNLTTDGVAGPATLSALQNGITSGQNSNSSEQNSNSTNNILSSGSEGTEVAALQVGLAAAGYYNGSVDGIYGTGTETSVANFQTDNDLEPDGVAGPDTLLALTGETQLVSNLSNRKLETIPFKPPTVGLASEAEENKGQYIVALHALLKVNLPNLPNEPEISEEVYKEFQKDVELAEFESATKEIITKFQEQQGLNADGIVGVRTWAALLSRENEATPPESVPPSLVSITSPEGFTSTLVVLTD